jgi:hypothetical protein
MPARNVIAGGEQVSLSSVYAREDDLVTRRVAGETILVPVRAGVGDLDSIYTLNEVGGAIWELIDGCRTVEEIALAVTGTHVVPIDEARQDSLEFLGLLEAGGLVRRVGT